MNKIYKIIWSRCSNAFVVVSELARSRSSGGGTSSGSTVNRRVLPTPLTALAAGLALALGLSTPAWAIEAAEPGGSVVEIGPPGNVPWVNGTDVKNTAYGNALQINGGAGEVKIKGGGTISVEPANSRVAGDTTPYAAIWVKQRSTTGDKTYFEHDYDHATNTETRVQAKVVGDYLHGVHVEKTGWLQTYSLDITATGDNTTGLHSDGQTDLRNITIDVKGDNAKGVYIGGSVNFDVGDKVTVSGSNVVGVEVAGRIIADGSHGNPALTVDVTGAADSDATGIHFNNGYTIRELTGNTIVVSNVDGKNTTGILLESLSHGQDSITFDSAIGPNNNSTHTKISVTGNSNPDAGAVTRGIDVRPGLTVNLIRTEAEVKGHSAVGIALQENSKAVLSGGSSFIVEGDAAKVVDATLGSKVTVNDSIMQVTGTNAAGISLDSANADISNNTKISVNTGPDGESYGTGIFATGTSELTIANSHIEVGRAGKLQHTGIDLKDLSGGSATLDTVAIVANSNGSRGIRADNSAFTFRDHVTINMYGSNSQGVELNNGASATINTSFINMHGQQSSAVKASGQSVATIDGGTLSGTGTGLRGVHAFDESRVNLSGTDITIRGGSSYAVQAYDDAIVNLENAKLDVEGAGAYGLAIHDQAKATISSDTTIDVRGSAATGAKLFNNALLVMVDTELTVDDMLSNTMVYGIHSDKSTSSLINTKVDVTAKGTTAGAYGIHSDNGATTSLNHVELIIDGDRTARGVNVFGGSELLTSNGSSITAKSLGGGGNAMGVYASDNAKVTLADTNIYVEGPIASGILAESSELTVSGGNIEVKGLGGSEAKGGSSSKSTVKLEGATVLSQGLKSIGWNSLEDAQFHMADSSIQASSDRLSLALVIEKLHSDATAGITGSTLSATATDPDGQAVAVYAEQSNVNIADSTLSATGSGGDNFVVTAYIDEGDVHISDSTLTALGTDDYVSTLRVTSGKLTMSGATLSATGQDFTSALSAGGGSAHIADSTLTATGSHADARVAGIEMGHFDATLTNTTVEATGQGDWFSAVYMGSFGATGTTLKTSDQTRLVSSQYAVLLESDGGSSQVSMTDTELVAGASTLHSFIANDAAQYIDMGSGVVATVNDGTLLQVERDVTLPSGRLELNISDGAQVAGAILDDVVSLADLTANGGTHVSISNADYSGNVQNARTVTLANAARIGGGTVATPNTVLEDIHVSSDATLAGNWAIGGTLHASNGRIAPGNSIGVTTANAINWGAGTIYEVEVNAAGESDRVDVTGAGAANVSNTALHVMQENGTGGYRLNHDYTILTAAGGVDGQFTEASWQGSELIKVNSLYGPNQIDISLSVGEKELAVLDLTPNQRATSDGALSVAGANLAADAAFLSNDPAVSFDMLSGEIHPSTRAGLMNSSALLSSAILGRLRDRSSAQPSANAGIPDLAASYPLWVSYSHNQQTAKGDSNTAKRKHKIDSFALGGDAEVGASWKMGGAFAYANSDIKLTERKSSSDIDSYSLAVYAGNSWENDSGAVNLLLGLGHTWHDLSTHRNVDLGGSQALKASYDARTMQIFGELGYAMPMGERSRVEPYLGLTWLQHRTDGFSESGGPAALKGARGTDDVTFSNLGLRAMTQIEAGKTAVNLRAGLGWRHAFGDHQPNTTLSFIQGGGSAFKVAGAPIARNTMVFDLGAEVQVGRHTSIGLGYEGQAGSGFTEHAGSLYLKARF